jgi:hypothetical protein
VTGGYRTLTRAAAVRAAAFALPVVLAACSAPMSGLAVPSGSAALDVTDQTGFTDTVVVRSAVAPVDAWLVVQTVGADGLPGMPLGVRRLPAGRSAELTVPVTIMGRAPTVLYVSLFADRGVVGTFEADMARMEASKDRPLMVDGRALVRRVKVEPYGVQVRMTQAMIAGPRRLRIGGDVKIDSVLSPSPAWVVVRRVGQDSAVGAVVGVAPVRSGTTTDVIVPLPGVEPGIRLQAALHADLGIRDVFEFDPAVLSASPDRPYYADGMEVADWVTML